MAIPRAASTSSCPGPIRPHPPSRLRLDNRTPLTEIAPHAFLDLLLETELSGREARRVKTSLRLSNLPTGQTLENFDFAFQPAIERSRIDSLPPVRGSARRKRCLFPPQRDL